MAKLKFIFPDTRWGLEMLKRRLQKAFLLPRLSITTTSADIHEEISIEKDVAVPMRDGVHLFTDIYKPKTGGCYPVILTRMPYGKSEYYCYIPAIGRFWAKKGYAYVAQDVRGKWRSGGEWDPFVNEINDGYDTLEWVAGQPWCDGNIGMMGESYYGYTTWAAATTGHPNLKCISPSTTALDIYGSWIYNSGAFCLQTMGTWAIEMNTKSYKNPLRINYNHLPLSSMDDAADFPCRYFQDWSRHNTRDSYWEKINLTNKVNQIKIPALHFGGWYDTFLKATIDDWLAMRERNDVGENQWLVIGPWDHNYSPDETSRIGKLDIGEASQGVYWTQTEAFFDHWLRGTDNGFDETPRVRYFTVGSNQWQDDSQWPPKRKTACKFYLHSQGNAHLANGDGVLDKNPPITTEPGDGFTFDPCNPVSMTLDLDFWDIARVLKDRTNLPERPDVLVYDTAPLPKDMEITGPLTLTLYASSSAVETDFTAALVDVSPTGYAHLIQEGVLRSSFRQSDKNPSLIKPGKVYEFNIDLWATSHVIKSGHRMRIEVSSSNFNRFDINPNTGEPFGTASTPIPAQQKIYHSTDYPSHLNLSIG